MESWKENRNEAGEATYAGALRAPRAGSPDCVFVFVFVFVYVKFELFLTQLTSVGGKIGSHCIKRWAHVTPTRDNMSHHRFGIFPNV